MDEPHTVGYIEDPVSQSLVPCPAFSAAPPFLFTPHVCGAVREPKDAEIPWGTSQTHI